jgi:virulence-associated protein VagC
MKTTRVFKSGNSLAVRLPREFAVKEKELCITKVGNTKFGKEEIILQYWY